MLKYTNRGNFKPMGEIGGMFSHIYQFVENIKENPSIILINGFVEEQKVFKGKLYNNSKKFIIEKLEEDEIKHIEEVIGNFKEVDFKDFIKNTAFDNEELNSFTNEIKGEWPPMKFDILLIGVIICQIIFLFR